MTLYLSNSHPFLKRCQTGNVCLITGINIKLTGYHLWVNIFQISASNSFCNCLDDIGFGSRGQTFRCHTFVYIFSCNLWISAQNNFLSQGYTYSLHFLKDWGTWCSLSNPLGQERVSASCTVHTIRQLCSSLQSHQSPCSVSVTLPHLLLSEALCSRFQ